MSSMVKVRCPVCDTVWEVPYRLIGAEMVCPGCDRTEVPEVPIGTVLPDTGYELTFADFQQLLRDSHGHRRLRQRLGELLGYAIDGQGDDVTIRSSDGRIMDPLAIHEQVQEDSDRQLELYREAMAQWR